MKRVHDAQPTPGFSAREPSPQVQAEGVFPKLIPREISRHILGFLLPDACGPDELPALAKSISSVFLASRSCAQSMSDAIAALGQSPAGRILHNELSRFFERQFDSFGLNRSAIAGRLLARFSVMKLRAGQPALHPDAAMPGHIDCGGIKLGVLQKANVPATWTGTIFGRIKLADEHELCLFLSWVQQHACHLLLTLELDDAFPKAPALGREATETIAALCEGQLSWQGEIRFAGQKAHRLACWLLPQLAAHCWSAESRENRVTAGRCNANYQVPAPDASWTEVGLREAPPRSRFAQALVIEDVYLSRLKGMRCLRSYSIDLNASERALPAKLLGAQARLESVELLLSKTRYGIMRCGPYREKEYLRVLSGKTAASLRHLLLATPRDWSNEYHDKIPCLLEAQLGLETLTLDFLGREVLESQELWNAIARLTGLQRLTLINCEIVPPARRLATVLGACTGLREFCFYAKDAPTQEWMSELAPSIAAHAGLQVVELPDADLDQLAPLCAQQGRGEIVLYSRDAALLVERGSAVPGEPGPALKSPPPDHPPIQ